MSTETISFEEEVNAALIVLRAGGVILYPTDTVWGLGCDAGNAEAVSRIYTIKHRADSKSLIVLVADERAILRHVAAPDLDAFTFMQSEERPTTVIFNDALDLPENLIAQDGSIAIRIVRDPFCRHLIKRLGAPIVSTSANISGMPTPASFEEISGEILAAVDHIPHWRRSDIMPAQPSQIARWENGGPVFLRK